MYGDVMIGPIVVTAVDVVVVVLLRVSDAPGSASATDENRPSRKVPTTAAVYVKNLTNRRLPRDPFDSSLSEIPIPKDALSRRDSVQPW